MPAIDDEGGYGDKTRFVYSAAIGEAKLQPDENEFPLLRPEVSRMSFCVFEREYRQCKGEVLEGPVILECTRRLSER